MPKLKVNSNELQGTDVNFVSLVKRGANRIPFRIVKEDTEEMLDLNAIGRKFFQKAEPTPGVLAVMVNKDAKDFDAIKEQLKTAGLNVEKSEEKDGIVFFKQEGQAEFDTGVIKINDDVGMIVSGIKKSFCGWDFDSTSFGEIHKVSSFYPSMRASAEIFADTVSNIMQKADTPKEAADMIGNAVNEFKTYLTALAGGLPERAFKSEVAFVKAGANFTPTFGNDTKTPQQTIGGAKDNNIDGDPTHGNETGHDGKDGGKKPDATVEGTISNDIEGSPAVLKEEDDAIAKAEADLAAAKAKKAEKEAELEKSAKAKDKEMTDEEKAKAKKADDDAAAAAAAAKKPEATAKSDEQGGDQLLKSIEALLGTKLKEATASFEGAVEALKSEVATIKVSAEKAVELAKKADEAVSGTVNADAPEDKSNVRKTDRTFKSAPPLLDTAYEAA